MKDLIISAALTGGGAVAHEHSADKRPVTPDEIARDVVACAKAGAAICHIHARNAEGRATNDLAVFTEIMEKTRKALKEADVDVILNLTTSGGLNFTEQRIAPIVALHPEMCSYDAGTLNWYNDGIFYNTPEFLMKLGKAAMENGVKPEIEVFDSGMIRNAVRFADRGFLARPLHFQFVLGTYSGMEATVENMEFLRSMLPEGSTFSVTGIGRHALPMMLAALAMEADGIRVGLEDNLFLRYGVPATNEELVRQAVHLGTLAGRKIATAARAREILSLPPNNTASGGVTP